MEELENILNYKFKNKMLLKEALTHPSMSFKNKHFNYERMEFFGDSILSMVIIEYLYNKYNNEKEGQLSKRKAYLVSKETLSNIANSMNIGKFIIMTKGEENCGGRTNINNLENVMEAIIAAIYLDCLDINVVRDFILKIWKPIDIKEKIPHNDPKSKLQEWTQKYYKILPEYKIIKKENVDGIDYFYVKLSIPNGMNLKDSGTNLKRIEENLAKNMLNMIGI